MRTAARYTLCSVLVLFALWGCAGKPSAAEREPKTVGGSPPESLYFSLVEGLHVTGTPVDVDLAEFRLRVDGAVDRPLSLSFEQVRELPAVREELSLVCPGFFVDRGVWTGVPVREVLARAGVRPGASRVTFTSLDGGYSQSLRLEELQDDGTLIAYEFNGRLFHRVHGFPLRLAARDKAGSYWVKWLGSIKVEE
jgi:DMSO/TMAO reductase YedYZ molybdopterin-dependent catalytic subunit